MFSRFSFVLPSHISLFYNQENELRGCARRLLDEICVQYITIQCVNLEPRIVENLHQIYTICILYLTMWVFGSVGTFLYNKHLYSSNRCEKIHNTYSDDHPTSPFFNNFFFFIVHKIKHYFLLKSCGFSLLVNPYKGKYFFDTIQITIQ